MLEVADRLFNFEFTKTSAELGREASVLLDVEANREFAGKCELELLGLPAGTVCTQAKVEYKPGTERVVFPVKIEEKARVGQHKTLVVRATVTDEKGAIRQTQGTGILQIDKPLPAPAKKPAAESKNAKQASDAKPADKPLSRLEQLRLLHEQNEEAKPE